MSESERERYYEERREYEEGRMAQEEHDRDAELSALRERLALTTMERNELFARVASLTAVAGELAGVARCAKEWMENEIGNGGLWDSGVEETLSGLSPAARKLVEEVNGG